MPRLRHQKQPQQQQQQQSAESSTEKSDQPDELLNKLLESEDQKFKSKFLNLFQKYLKESGRSSPELESELEESEDEENDTERKVGSSQPDRSRGGRRSSEVRRKRKRLQGNHGRRQRSVSPYLGYGRYRRDETTSYDSDEVSTMDEDEYLKEHYDTTRRGGPSQADRAKGGFHSGLRRRGFRGSRRRARSPSPYLGRGRFRRDNDTESEESEDEYLKEHYDTTRRGGPSQADRAKGGFHSGEARRIRKLKGLRYRQQ